MGVLITLFPFLTALAEYPIKAGTAVGTCPTEGGSVEISSTYTPGVL
jgi:hypothetical protein